MSFWKCFSFERVVGGWVGGLVGFWWIVCWHELVVLFKCLKVTTFMARKWVTMHGGQSNEYMNTSDSVAKTSTMVSLNYRSGNHTCFVK